jgi:hypothetical protein
MDKIDVAESKVEAPMETPVIPVIETPKKKKAVKVEPKPTVKVRCPDCPWKPGLRDERTLCPTCNGTGKVDAEPLE